MPSKLPSVAPGYSYALIDVSDDSVTQDDANTLYIILGILIFFVSAFLLTDLFLLPWYTAKRIPANEYRATRLELRRYSEQISRNFYAILEGYGQIWEEWRQAWRKWSTKPTSHNTSYIRVTVEFGEFVKDLSTLIFVLLFLVAIILIAVATASTPNRVIADKASAGLIIFFISVNAMFVNRMLRFYKHSVEVKKKIAAHGKERKVIDKPLPDQPKHLSIILPLEPVQSSADESGADENAESNPSQVDITEDEPSSTPTATIPASEDKRNFVALFDQSFNYKRRIKHITPQFYGMNRTFGNFVQIILLMTEFTQLAFFPVRDLMRNSAFQKIIYDPKSHQGARNFINGLLQFFTVLYSGLPSADSLFLTKIQFAFAFWITILVTVIAIGLTLLYHFSIHADYFTKRPSLRRKVMDFCTGTWILSMLPLLNLFYLVILISLIDPLGCLSDSSTPSWPKDPKVMTAAVAIKQQQFRCSLITTVNPPLNTFLALLGYFLAYFLLTAVKTSPEPKPKPGIISFTSRSEIVHKNGALIILLLYTLIPTQASSTARGILAAFVLLALILYNIIIGSSYIRWVNVIKANMYICLLWLTLVVVVYVDPKNNLIASSGTGIFITVLIGWIVLTMVWLVLFYWVLEAHHPFQKIHERQRLEGSGNDDKRKSMRQTWRSSILSMWQVASPQSESLPEGGGGVVVSVVSPRAEVDLTEARGPKGGQTPNLRLTGEPATAESMPSSKKGKRRGTGAIAESVPSPVAKSSPVKRRSSRRSGEDAQNDLTSAASGTSSLPASFVRVNGPRGPRQQET